MQRIVIVSAVLFLLASPWGLAAEHESDPTQAGPGARGTEAGTSLLTVDAPEQVVTPTRTARTADGTLASVTVIDRADIERQQARSVRDVMRALPGIAIANQGGAGKLTTVFLRGTASDHVLVLIDGVKVGSATNGLTQFQHIPIDQIERIEVVRGPRSSLYGSEAIGGVIQIFTRKGGGGTRPHFSLGGGSHDTVEASAGVSGGGERGWFNVTASGIGSEGFNACDGKPFPDGAGCFTVEPDPDGYRNHAESLRGGVRFGNGLTIDVHALHSAGATEFDGEFQNETEFVQQVAGARLEFLPVEAWRVSLAGGRSKDLADNLKDGVKASTFNTSRDTASLQNDIAVGGSHLLTLGGDWQEDRVESDTEFEVTSRDNVGVFLQYQGELGAHGIQLSGRRDDNEQFGTYDTQGAAWGYDLTDDWRVVASYGTAFKAPTFNDLFFPLLGNPDLEPETSQSAEAGLAYGPVWSLNVYETEIEDLIAFNAATFLPENVDRARIRGVEATYTPRFGGFLLDVYLTLLDPRNRSRGENRGNVLPRRVRESLRVDATQQIAAFAFGTTVVANGKRYDDLANTREIDAYTTVDLRAEYGFASDWTLQGRVGNVFDEDYETAAFFNQPGRTWFVTLRYRP